MCHQQPATTSHQLGPPSDTCTDDDAGRSLSLRGRNFPKSRCDPVVCAARNEERGSDRTFNSKFGALILQRNHIRGVMRRNVSPGADSWWPISNDLSLRPHFNIFTLRFLHLLFLEIESVRPSVCGDYWLDVGWYYSLSRKSSCHFSGLDCRSFLRAVWAHLCSCTKKTKHFHALSLVQVLRLDQSSQPNNQSRSYRKVKSSHLWVVVERLIICKLVNDLWLYVLTLFPAAIRVFHW